MLLSLYDLAGAKHLIGFIAAPEMKENRKISNPTIAPDAIHHIAFSPFEGIDVNIIAIKNVVIINSTAKTSKIQ